MFFGRCNLTSMAAFLGAMAVIILILAGMDVILSSGDFIVGMSMGMSVMLAGVVPLTGIIFLNALYTYTNSATQGYKYYRSIPDSAEQFHRAVIAANVFSLVIGLLLLGVMTLVFILLKINPGMSFLGLVMLLAVMGLCNLFGYVRNAIVKVTVISGAICGTGFATGFVSAAEEDESSFSEVIVKLPWLMFVLLGAAVLLFAAGLVYTIAVSRRKWVME